MSRGEINGYIIVSPNRGGIYRGVDRDPWNTVDSAYYSHTLPPPVRKLYDRMKRSPERGFWWPTTPSIEEALTLLRFTQTQEPDAELIGVYSPYLRQHAKRKPWREPLDFLGVDVLSIGEWSLLNGLEQASLLLQGDIRKTINEHGLLCDESSAARLEEYYRHLSEKNLVEAIASASSGILIEPVHVYLPKVTATP